MIVDKDIDITYYDSGGSVHHVKNRPIVMLLTKKRKMHPIFDKIKKIFK